MIATNIKPDPQNNAVSAEFQLQSQQTMTVYAGWCNNEGERWSFDVAFNLIGRHDYSYETRSFDKSSIDDAARYLGVTCTRQEIDVINNFIVNIRDKDDENLGSAHDSYYGV